MGVFKLILYSFVPVTVAASVVALRLGSELPKATRNTGRRIGMLYNYLKIVLKLITPKSRHSIEVVRKMRQSGQQAFALTNEIKWNLLDLKPEVNRILPDLTADPIGLQSLVKEEKRPERTEGLSGTAVLSQTFQERRRIIDAKREKKEGQDTFNRL